MEMRRRHMCPSSCSWLLGSLTTTRVSVRQSLASRISKERLFIRSSGPGTSTTTIKESLLLAAVRRFVTMLQRSPSYLFTTPEQDPVDNLIRKFSSTCFTRWVYQALRWKYIFGFWLFYTFSIRFPGAAKKFLRKSTESQLPADVPFDPHFVPKYNPWDQRVCVTPHGDFFAALGRGNANIVTDHIETVDKTGIVLKSGG